MTAPTFLQLSRRKIDRLVKAHRDGEVIDDAAIRKYTKVSSPEYLALYSAAFQESAGLKPQSSPLPKPYVGPRIPQKTFVLIEANGVERELKLVRETPTTAAFEKN